MNIDSKYSRPPRVSWHFKKMRHGCLGISKKTVTLLKLGNPRFLRQGPAQEPGGRNQALKPHARRGQVPPVGREQLHGRVSQESPCTCSCKLHKPEIAARRSSQVENTEKRHGYAVGPVPQLHERAPELAAEPADFYSAARGCQPPPGTRIRL